MNPLPNTKVVSYVYGVEEGVVERVEHVRCSIDSFNMELMTQNIDKK